jgi:endo-1,4-beta-xylanase
MPVVDQNGPTIKDTYAKHFLIGTAGTFPGTTPMWRRALIQQNFGVVTPENCMKPAPIHPAEDTWRFERPMRW